MNKQNYIVVESSENDDPSAMPLAKDIHHEDDGASLRTMNTHGVIVEQNKIPMEQSIGDEDSARNLFSQNGIEIIKESVDLEQDSV